MNRGTKKLVAMRFSAATQKALKKISRQTKKNKTQIVEEAIGLHAKSLRTA